MALKLYHAEPGANSLKSLILLKEKGLEFESVYVENMYTIKKDETSEGGPVMRYMRHLVFVLATLPLAAEAADFSGKWTMDGDVSGNPVNLSCDILQEEAKIAGTCVLNGMEPSEISGDMQDAAFDFSFDSAGYRLNYTGTIEGDSVKGNIEVAGVSGTFTGARAEE